MVRTPNTRPLNVAGYMSSVFNVNIDGSYEAARRHGAERPALVREVVTSGRRKL